MPEEFKENVYDASSAPSSFELKFIECAHVITVPLRVYPDPHAPKPRPAAPARYDSRDFFSRPVPVPGRCPACHNARPVTKPETKPTTKPFATAAAAGASTAGEVTAAIAAGGSNVAVATEPEPTPPP